MTIHKEGYKILTGLFVILVLLNTALFFFTDGFGIINWIVLIVSVGFYLFILKFFRSPKRLIISQEGKFLSPADGKIVIIEENHINEYFDDKRLQVSIFMSAHNVHINWNPVSGIIKYFKYHPGKFFIASLPKASEFNEHTSIVYETDGKQIMVRQIAGFVARRIVYYLKEGMAVNQAEQFGFIKFGSRIDIFFPLGTKLNVSLNQKVKGTETVIAEL